MDAGVTCIDRDGDGFGHNCAKGRDCDDGNPASTNECRACIFPEAGCACDPGQQPISCFLPDLPAPEGNVMCREGTRYCRGGLWSQCEDVHSYVVTPDPTLAALIDPDATPENCSLCQPKCFKVTDPLLGTDAGAPGNGVTYGGGGGLQLAPGDGGTAGDGSTGDGGSTLTGCAALAACCDTLTGAPQAQGNCELVVSENNDAHCDVALGVYCPSVITGPVDGCTIGGSSLDVDCDGIPDELDECTPDTIATNPACNGSVLPLSTTNNQTIFHVLDKGETGSNSLEVGFKVQNADVYFLMDMSWTMSEERDNLVSAMTGGNVVECALLKNCCDNLSNPASRTACMNVVNAENQNNCRNAQATHCAGNPALVDCPDLDFDGLPDNQLKNQGVVGAVRCLVGSSWFGAGTFSELPFRSGLLDPGSGNTDENTFRHFLDMTPDVARVRETIRGFQTNSNYDYPEASMVALYSVLTGKGHMFGHNTVSVPDRLGLGCPAGTSGYPCFRPGTIPIVVLFTDDPMSNGPPVYSAPYPSYFNLNQKAPTSGAARFTPAQAEAFATAFNLGDVRDQFIIASGNTTFMTGDYPAAVTGCGAEAGAPDAVYRFTVSPQIGGATGSLLPAHVRFALNTRLDPGGYSSPPDGNGPSPATGFPVVLSLYRGIPATVQAPTNVGETRINPIPSGPDLAYLTYVGTSAGPNESRPGFLGGISGCGADGATNEVIFTFRPVVDARIVVDASESDFDTVVSLHEGLPQTLPPNPSTLGTDRVVLVGPTGNTHDTFSTARRVDRMHEEALPESDWKIDGDYVQYSGDMIATQDEGTGSTYNLPGGKAGTDDYDEGIVACGVNPAGADAVFAFEVETPRRVRIDTEGSNFRTVISLHDAPPPETHAETGITGNDSVIAAKRVGTLSGDTVSNTAYRVHSDAAGTTALSDSVAPMCGGTPTLGSNDAYFSFRLTRPTHLNLSALGGNTASANEAVNTPGAVNLGATATPPPASPGADPVINEFAFRHAGGDTREYVEIAGQALTSYGHLSVVQIEGDGGGAGTLDRVITVGTTDAQGLWVSAFTSSALEEGTSTLLLVEGFNGSVGVDYDTDDDGVIDAPAPWTRVLDGVAVHDGGGSRVTYATPVLMPDFDAGSTPVVGASRLPSGRDTDSESDWARNDFDGQGLPGAGFEPAVFLYSSVPGSVAAIDAADPNGDGDLSDANSHNNAATALDLGDVYGQITTRVINADLGHTNTNNQYARTVVSCNPYAGSEPPGTDDHVYRFTPSHDGTARVEVETNGSAYHAVGVFDGPPPIAGAINTVQLFDASALAPAPDSSCTAHSWNGHVYWFCANSRSWAQAQSNCHVVSAHLARVDDAAENAFLAARRTSTQAWLGGRDESSSSPRQFRWKDTEPGDVFWSSSGGSLLYTSFRSGEPSSSSQDCLGYNGTGANAENWADLSCGSSYHYICEDPAPASAPPENQATAYAVGTEVGANGNLSGRVLSYRGSTRRMQSDLNGLLMSTCGATEHAPDAVFRITPDTTINAEIDTSGSSFPAIVGLFDTTIDAGGFMGCDAPGVAPGTDVTQTNPPVSTAALTATLIGGRTYYAVITGTATSQDGAYRIKFADLSAGGNGALLACGVESAGSPARVEVDFHANQTYYVVVESTASAGSAYDMSVHSLYATRAEYENPQALNEHGGTAFPIGDPFRSKHTVQSTSTAGMVADYTAGSGGTLTCGGPTASQAPDAVYTFTPTIDTNIKISANMPGRTPVVALFRGQPDAQPTTTDLGALGNTNEGMDSAYSVDLAGPPRILVGDTSGMGNDVDGSLLACGAAPSGRDAVFRFTLAQETEVRIDASASTATGMMGDPVIALFDDDGLARPASVTLENDSYLEASANPSPTPVATESWHVWDADMANLTPNNQAQYGVAATNTNDLVIPATLEGAQALGDVWNTRVTVSGGDSSALHGDYALSCGGHDDAPDAIYEFHTSQAGRVRISTAQPAPGFDTVLQLYDGSTGAPLRRIDDATITVNLNDPEGHCGDTLYSFGEECDDGNIVPGDGCDANCQFEPGVWRCLPEYYGDGDCDCGCGIVDVDCADATVFSCEYYAGPGNCMPFEANPFFIDPNNNAECKYTEGIWFCDPLYYGDGFCDCGCGALDIDCAANDLALCEFCEDPPPYSCNIGGCSNIDPTDIATCTTIMSTDNPNDTLGAAVIVNLAAGGTRQYVGNTSALASNLPATQLQCGALDGAPDAFFEFSLRRESLVEIDASASPNPPVLALFDSGALGSVPNPVPLANDNANEADANPSPTPQLSGSWVRYSTDLSELTISTQPQTEISNRDNVNDDAPTNLWDPMNRRLTVVDADTGHMSGGANTMEPTFASPMCGGVAATVDDARDALYRFVPSASGQVRISTNYPETAGFDNVIALYDGSSGKLPLKLSDVQSVSIPLGQAHEAEASAQVVPIEDGVTTYYSGTTAGMSPDVTAAQLQCGGGAAPDAFWAFSLAEPMDVEISVESSDHATVLGLFDGPMSRPSVTERRSLPAARVQLYDVNDLPGQPEPGCTPFSYNAHRYWMCSNPRPWDGAQGKCAEAGHALVTIDDATEQQELFSRVTATGMSHHIGLMASTPYQSWGSSPAGMWVSGSSSGYRNFAPDEPNEPLTNAGMRMLHDDLSVPSGSEPGRWVDVPSSYQAYPYICEETSAGPELVQPTAANKQEVDLFGSRRRFVGSTQGMPSTVGNLVGCGASATAPDAVFRIPPRPHTAELTIDFGSSFAGAVVGLFQTQVGPGNEVACAPATSGDPKQLTHMLLANTAYDVVLTGSSGSTSGRYDITFSGLTTDPSAFTFEYDTLAEAIANSFGPIEKRWVVGRADMGNLTTDLISSRVVDMLPPPGIDTNDSHVPPFQIRSLNSGGSMAGEQVTVVDASTVGLAGDYAAPSCGGSDDGPDAIYSFRPAADATVRIELTTEDHDAVIALFDGSGGELPRLHGEVLAPPVALPNTNEAPSPASAQSFTFGDPVTFTGNLSAMASDVPSLDAAGRPWDPSDLHGGDGANLCRPAAAGPDAFFRFEVTGSEPKSVVIDSSGTDFEHTLALFGESPLVAPAAVSMEYETSAAAIAATPVAVDDRWYVFSGSTANLRPADVTRSVRQAGTHFANDDAIQDLGTLTADSQLVTSGASTAAAAVTPDYLRECGASDDADDMIFRFRTGGTSQTVHIGANNPSPAFPVVLQLWDGSSGDPQTAGELDPTPVPVAGNDSYAAAHDAGSLGATPLAFSGDTSGNANSQAAPLYDRAANFGGDSSNMCNAGAAASDAFYRFHLDDPTRLRVQVAGDATAYAHTLALYRASPPLSLPAASAGGHDTHASAIASPAPIDDAWLHYATAMSGYGVEGLTTRTLRAGTEFQNAAGVQDLEAAFGASINGAQYRTASAALADTTGTGSSYPAPMCGGAVAANDMIFRIATGAATTLRIGIDDPSPGFNPVLAVYDGAPLTLGESSGATRDLGAIGNPNETLVSADPVLAGARARFLGDASSMASDYDGDQFEAFGLACTPAAAGPDAFVEIEVVGIPKTAREDLALWVDAADEDYLTLSGSSVSAAQDKSGLGQHVTQGVAARRPARQSRGNGYAIELNPAGDTSPGDSGSEDSLLRDPAAGDSPLTVFAVWRLLNTSFLSGAELLGTSGGAAGFGLAMSADGASGSARLRYRDSNGTAVDMTAALSGASAVMLSGVTHAADGSIVTYLNGSQHATAIGRPDGSAYQRFRLGASADGLRGLPADVHELVVVTRALSQAEREEIEGYLAHKWGFAASLPLAHPYRAAPPARTVEISSENTAFAHTLSFFDAIPMSRPAATPGTAHDTAPAANASPLGAVDGAWYVRDASTAGLSSSELTSVTRSAGTHFDNADSDHHGGGVPDLGDVSGRSLRTSGADTGALAGDYPTSTLTCSFDSAAPDAIFQFTPSTSTRVAIRAESAVPGAWMPVVGLYDGTSGVPRDAAATFAATPVNLNFSASNYDHGAYSYNNAVNWNCSGTTTFDSSTGSFSGTTSCSDTAAERPEVTCGVAQTAGGGPDVCILRAASLDIASGHTLRLLGTRPVILAVDGNVTIAGTIDASASGSTAGAGGNWSCGSATGDSGEGNNSTGGGGGGGGAFGTGGGDGGESTLINAEGGEGGNPRGNSSLMPLLGGCGGGSGGGCSNAAAGGGAFQISASGTLTVTGTLRANGGQASNGCGSEGGGGGGGSGGGILLEATSVMTGSATIQARGGRGGNGADGGSGGNGSTSSSNSGSNGENETTEGAGGGGGGYGRVVSRVATGNTNEAAASAQAVTIGALQTFDGNTSSMASNIAASAFDTATEDCHAAGSPDAVFRFTLGSATPVRISSAGSSFDTAIAIWSGSIGSTATACAFGNANAGASIEQTLSAGTYYVAITGNASTGGATSGAYRLTFSNLAVTGGAAAALACSASDFEHDVTAGVPYYVVVKGAGAADFGTYTLHIDDVGAVTDMACAGRTADDAAPDAFVGFSTTATRDVTVDLDGSMLDAVFELWREDGGSDVLVGCAATSGSATSIAAQLAAGSYYVKLRGTEAMGGLAELPFRISIRDDDVQRASDCADAAAGSGHAFTKSLAPGTYYVGITPQNGQAAGAYELAVRDTSYAQSGGAQVACTTGTTLELPASANAEYYVLVKGETASDRGSFGLTITDVGASAVPLGCADPASPDAFYAFTVADSAGPAGQDVEVSITNGYAAAFQLYRDDGVAGNRGDDTAIGGCLTAVSHTYPDLGAGSYYLVVKGTSVAGGAARQPLQVAIRDADGAGALACADGTSAAPAAIEAGALPASMLDAQGRLLPGDYYLAFSGQSSNGPYEVQLADLNATSGGSAALIECATDQDITATLAANTDYYVIVKGDGAAHNGAFTLAVTDVSSVQEIDPLCPTDPAAPDGYAAFTLASGPRDITIDMSNSALAGAYQVFDAATDAPVPGCGCASLTTPQTCTLTAGTYYVAFRGATVAAGNGEQPFELVLRDDDALGSIACENGPITAGRTLVVPDLDPGTYYVGIIPSSTNGSSDLDYRLMIRDQDSTLGTAAPELDCQSDVIQANVIASEDYFIVVKGLTASDAGDYGLVVQDMSGVPSFGCGDDLEAGDAFYAFEVTEPGTQVTIDTEGSELQTVIALFPDGANFAEDLVDNDTHVAPPDGRPDDMIACDADSGVLGTSRLTTVLDPGRYFAVVRAREGAPDPTLSFNISVRDDASTRSIACDVDDGGERPRIRQILQPGTYYVALSGEGSASGNYDLRFRDYGPIADAAPQVGSCGGASDTIFYDVTAGTPYYVLVKGGASDEQGPYKLTVENLQTGLGMGCGSDPRSPDAFYKFSLAAETDVVVDVGGAADTVIALYSGSSSAFGTNYVEDENGAVVPCDDDGGVAHGGPPGSSRIEATLAPGDYYLVVKGKGAASQWGATSQPFTVSIRDATNASSIACAGSDDPRIVRELPPGDYTLVMSDDGPGGAYDVRFRDLTTQNSGATPLACNEAEDTIIADLEADTPYYVVVKGHGAETESGPYTLTVESVDSGATIMGCGADLNAADAFFKFEVTRQTEVTIDTIGSELDTVLAIYPGGATVFGTNYAQDAFGEVIACDNDGAGDGDSAITATLATGEYYAVVKGASATWGASDLPFNLSIRDNGASGAIACAGVDGAGTPVITRTLPPGDYSVVLSDTQSVGEVGSGGAYSITFQDLSTSGGETGMQIGCALGTLDGGDGDMDGQPDGVPVVAGEDYFVVVKGNSATDSGSYTLTLEDIHSQQAAAGSTPIACAIEGSAIDAVYPPGEYFAVVTGTGAQDGPYELNVRDVDAFFDSNRLACAGPDQGEAASSSTVAEPGPNGTSVIEADLLPGTHYVVVKGDGPGQTGTYKLNIRDTDAHPDRALACGDVEGGERLEYDVVAGRDYTVLLKGNGAGQQGSFNVKLYDELGLQSSSGSLVQCQTVCPDIAPYNCKGVGVSASSNSECCSDRRSFGRCVASSQSSCKGDNVAASTAEECCSGVRQSNGTCAPVQCTNAQMASNGFARDLGADTYYLTVKGRKANEKGFYELQIGDSDDGASISRYTPPTWTEVRDAIHSTGVKVLPVLSCPEGGNSGRCDGTEAQARVLAQESGAAQQSTGQPIVKYINENGTGIGSGLALAVRDLANYLAMDITLSVVNNPGFEIQIQKCTNPTDPTQAACTAFSSGCLDTAPIPRNTINDCQPGATPKFLVSFTNPLEPDSVAPNPDDPNGGYHFKLQIVGDHQYLLDEVPVYIIPTENEPMMPPPPGGAGTYQSSGTYEQQVFGAGCNYYLFEGEGSGSESCSDGVDNDMDGRIDRGHDANHDGDYDDADEYPPDEGCVAGSCIDGVDNDGHGGADAMDPDCATTDRQNWTDLFFRADVPPGTAIDFDVCTADTEAALSTECANDGAFSRVATVTSVSGACATNAECQNVNVGGTTKDGFCGASGQCQFIDPPKLSTPCTTDAHCPNGDLNGETITSTCDTSQQLCRYASPPADLGSALDEGQNGRPFIKVKIRLRANEDASASPTLYDWYFTYYCASSN